MNQENEFVEPVQPVVTPSAVVVTLTIVIAVAALVAAAAGLFWQSSNAPERHVSVQGVEVEIYGQGLYRHDSVLRATGNRGADLLMIVGGVPILLISTLLYHRVSLRGTLLLLGILFWTFYLYTTLMLGTEFNELFLLYVLISGACFYALILTFSSIDLHRFPHPEQLGLPVHTPAIFLIVVGVVTSIIWLENPLLALVRGDPPTLLEHSTTLVTHALDLAIVVPAAFIAGALILRRDPLGYVIGFPLIFLVVVLAPMISIQTFFQIAAGIEFSVEAVIGLIASFIVMALAGVWAMVSLLKGIPSTASASSCR